MHPPTSTTCFPYSTLLGILCPLVVDVKYHHVVDGLYIMQPNLGVPENVAVLGFLMRMLIC